jgi:hypothetical protein
LPPTPDTTLLRRGHCAFITDTIAIIATRFASVFPCSMTTLSTGSVLRPTHGQQGHSPICQVVRCAAADPASMGNSHNFRGGSRKGLPLGQPHRDLSNHLAHASVLSTLEVHAKTLQTTMDSLLECQSSLDERRTLLEAVLARNDSAKQVLEPASAPHTLEDL